MSQKVSIFEVDASTVQGSLELVAKMMADGIYPDIRLKMRQNYRGDGTPVTYFWVDFSDPEATTLDLE
jgi:hypothetical protein